MNTEFHVRREIFNDSTSIWARSKSFGGLNNPVALPMELQFTDAPRSAPQPPTLVLECDEAQSLFQAMWDAGHRPNNGAGSGAEAEALRSHIKYAEQVTTTLLKNLPG